MANKKAALEVDYLTVVRERLTGMRRQERMRVAVEIGVSLETLQNIVRQKYAPIYTTVTDAYRAIQKMDQEARP
jgi:hypothetical protein